MRASRSSRRACRSRSPSTTRCSTFARREGIDLTVVGPDDALAAGIVDRFEDAGLRIFGPRAGARRGSNRRRSSRRNSCSATAFRRRARAASPTRRRRSASAQKTPHPLVVKADGLALGKGVIIARNRWEGGARDSRDHGGAEVRRRGPQRGHRGISRRRGVLDPRAGRWPQLPAVSRPRRITSARSMATAG